MNFYHTNYYLELAKYTKEFNNAASADRYLASVWGTEAQSAIEYFAGYALTSGNYAELSIPIEWLSPHERVQVCLNMLQNKWEKDPEGKVEALEKRLIGLANFYNQRCKFIDSIAEVTKMYEEKK